MWPSSVNGPRRSRPKKSPNLKLLGTKSRVLIPTLTLAQKTPRRLGSRGLENHPRAFRRATARQRARSPWGRDGAQRRLRGAGESHTGAAPPQIWDPGGAASLPFIFERRCRASGVAKSWTVNGFLDKIDKINKIPLRHSSQERERIQADQMAPNLFLQFG